MKKISHQVRVSVESDDQVLKSPKGRSFFDDTTAQSTNLSGTHILRCGVDTVRWLYNGKLRPEVMVLFSLSVDVVEFTGYEWSKSRIGHDSGYQYHLQNTEMDLILLIRSHSIKVDILGSYLKTEVSPHTLGGADPRILQGMLDDLAIAMLSHCETNQAAVYIALGVQSWKPPHDLVDRMHYHSRRVRQVGGTERIEFDGNTSVYGRGETYMFGSADNLQPSIHNKTLQARTTGKLDYWESIWATLNRNPFGGGDPTYNPLETVWRFKFHLRYSIVQQFFEGSRMAPGEVIGYHTYGGLCPHLQGLQSYAYESFRLLSQTAVYDPLQGLISQDTHVQVEYDPLIKRAEYRCYYKTAKGFSERSCEMFLGQFVSLIMRERVPAKKAVESTRKLEFWYVIEDHYLAEGQTRRDLKRHIHKLMCDRYLRRGYAV